MSIEENLLQALEVTTSTEQNDLRCTFVLGNGTPAEWNVIIAAAGCVFYYDDGTDDLDGPRPVNLRSGQNAIFRSKRLDGCVKRIFIAITAVAQGEPPQNFQETISDVPADSCMLQRSIELGRKRNIMKSDRAPYSSIELLEIK